LQQKITYAGTVSRSFAEGHDLLERLADTAVSVKQVERLTRRIGAERVAERDALVAAFQALPLPEKFGVPAGVAAPEVAAVMADGGRLQILDRAALAPAEPATAAAPAATTETAAAARETWEAEPIPAGHWREDKMALLLTLDSPVSTTDPCPTLPAAFLDAARMEALARDLSRHVKGPLADAADPAMAPAAAAAAAPAAPAAPVYQPPVVQRRQVLASRQPWPTFAPIVAQAAWAQGFQGARRRAFVGDGSANHWRLRRRCFGSFVPILDFIHALSYVYAAATAGRSRVIGWAIYEQWITWVWQGRVAEVIVALHDRQAELGMPEADEPDTSPRAVVARTLTYLGNQRDKMHYDEYRRQGLPITSSLMESTVKQVNRRVKGTEKFWSEAGAEALLQLRADQLSDDEPLADFWRRREAAATGQRRSRRAA